MEPQIGFCKRSDGVSIAYTVSGTGPPLLRTPGFPFNHLELEWDAPLFRAWYEALSARWTLIHYDPRGQGLSQRQGFEYSREASLRDLEAVAAVTDRARFERLLGDLDLE